MAFIKVNGSLINTEYIVDVHPALSKKQSHIQLLNRPIPLIVNATVDEVAKLLQITSLVIQLNPQNND